MALCKADRDLLNEATVVLTELAARAERERIHGRDPQVEAVLERADKLLWDLRFRLEPLC